MSDETQDGMNGRRKRNPAPMRAVPFNWFSTVPLNATYSGSGTAMVTVTATSPIRQETPADPPLPPQPAPRSTMPTYLPLILSVALILAQQLVVSLGKLPPSAPLSVVLALLVGICAALPLIQQILSQQQQAAERMQAKAQAHELRIAQITAGRAA